ncbi:hypothetical protein I6E29_04340 [Arcanobacterium haemolyticum]|nr:hypothetical protein [Arcanobacterium haemolyticum]
MKVVLAASALPGIRAAQGTSLARESWQAVRPQDDVTALPVSDGIAMPYVGSGIDDVVENDYECDLIELGLPHERHFARGAGRMLVVDYTDLLGGVPSESASTSEVIGRDLTWAYEQNYRDVYLVLPQFSTLTDLGYGLLSVCSDPQGERPDALDASSPANALAGAIESARALLASLSITVLAPGTQRLLGLSGLARSSVRLGLDSHTAQDLEATLGNKADALVAALQLVTEKMPSSDLLQPHGSNSRSRQDLHERYLRAPYAGVGSGVALMLDILGARIFPVGDFVVRERIDVTDADLVVYISGHIADDLPSGLVTTIQLAQDVGIPVVLIYDSGALRRGELPNLGLHGAYELRPHRAFADDDESDDDLASLATRLENTVTKVARTWGWD